MKTVSIVGRPNVGKSTLFNKITRQRIAIVEGMPGVTRDYLEREITYNNKKFILIDTGGIDISPSSPEKGEPEYSSPQIIKLVQKQIDKAIQLSEVVIFLLDAKDGFLPDDVEIAKYLRKYQKKIIPVVNKVDNEKLKAEALSFYQLGWDNVLYCSARQGKGIKELLEEITGYLPEEEILEEKEAIKIAIIGCPNVGKSSIINSILGDERQIVDAIPGTTRDSVDIKFHLDEKDVILIDTAGIRKKKKIKEQLEYYSVLRAQRSIERCDIVVLVIDAVKGVAEQDKKIAGIAKEEGKGIIIAVNKWDLIMGRKKKPGQKKLIHDWISAIKREFYFSNYAPIIFTSAKTQHRMKEIIPAAISCFQNYIKKIETPYLNKIIQKIITTLPPSGDLKIYYATQTEIKPPTFVFFVSHPDKIKENYISYLEKKLRSSLLLSGVPMRMIFRRK